MQNNNKKNWGELGLGIGLGGSIGLGIGLGRVNRVRNWYRVRAAGERVTLFEKHPPPKKWKNHLVRRKLTS